MAINTAFKYSQWTGLNYSVHLHVLSIWTNSNEWFKWSGNSKVTYSIREKSAWVKPIDQNKSDYPMLHMSEGITIEFALKLCKKTVTRDIKTAM